MKLCNLEARQVAAESKKIAMCFTFLKGRHWHDI